MDRDFALWRDGSEKARERIVSKYYNELKVLARHQLRRQKRTASLDTTDLQHVMISKILGSGTIAPKNKNQLLGLAAIVMRRALVDMARRKTSQKRAAILVSLDEDKNSVSSNAQNLLEIHNALIRLKVISPQQHDVVELKVFGGLSNREVANVLGMKLHKVKESWAAARNWMRVVIENGL